MNKQDILLSLGYTKGNDFPDFEDIQSVPMSAEVVTEKLVWTVYNRKNDILAVIKHVDHDQSRVLLSFTFADKGNVIEMDSKEVKTKVNTDEMLKRWNETRALDTSDELVFSL